MRGKREIGGRVMAWSPNVMCNECGSGVGSHMFAGYAADPARAEHDGRRLAQRFAGLGVTIDDQPIGSTRSCGTGCGGPTRR
jgi:hypothetical protein